MAERPPDASQPSLGVRRRIGNGTTSVAPNSIVKSSADRSAVHTGNGSEVTGQISLLAAMPSAHGVTLELVRKLIFVFASVSSLAIIPV